MVFALEGRDISARGKHSAAAGSEENESQALKGRNSLPGIQCHNEGQCLAEGTACIALSGRRSIKPNPGRRSAADAAALALNARQENNVARRIRAGPCRPGISGATRPGSEPTHGIAFLRVNKQEAVLPYDPRKPSPTCSLTALACASGYCAAGNPGQGVIDTALSGNKNGRCQPAAEGSRRSRRKRCAMRCVVVAATVAAVVCLAGGRLWAAGKPSAYLGDLTPKRQTGRVVGHAGAMGDQFNPGRERFDRGLKMWADSEVVYDVSAHAGRFEAWVGPHRWALDCTVAFRVYTDDRLAFDSGDVSQQPWQPGGRSPWQPARVSVPWPGAKELRLVVQFRGGEKRNAVVDWGQARLVDAAVPRLSAGSRWNSTRWRRRLPWAGTVGTAPVRRSTRS